MTKFEYNHAKLATPTILFKPSVTTFAEAEDDLGWSAMCESPVPVKTFDGNHVTILNNDLLAQEINKELGFEDSNSEESKDRDDAVKS